MNPSSEGEANESGRGSATMPKGRTGRHTPRPQCDGNTTAYSAGNPLVRRLYGDGISSDVNPSVPNRLTQSLPARRVTPAPHPPRSAKDTHHGARDGDGRRQDASISSTGSIHADTTHGNTTFVNSLQVFHPPQYRDDKLRELFCSPSQRSGGTSLQDKTRPAKLAPLAPAAATAEHARADATTPAPQNKSLRGSLSASRIPRIRQVVSSAPKEFVYMNPRACDSRGVANPYDLEVVTHDAINPAQYFTVSSSGVTRFTNGEAQFIELPTWRREAAVFDRLIELPVFRTYRRWRSFFIWRGMVRQQAIHSSRVFLDRNLFLLHPHLSGALQAVRKLCMDFVANHNMYLPISETRTIDALTFALGSHLNAVRGRLEKMMLSIRNIVEAACKATTLAAQLEREKEHALRDDDDHKKKKFAEAWAIGAQVQPSYIETMQRKATNERLLSFIRLCDYLVVTSVTRLAAKAVQAVHDDFCVKKDPALREAFAAATQPHGVPGKVHARGAAETSEEQKAAAFTGPLLSVEVRYSSEAQQIVCVPSSLQLLEAIEGAVKNYVKTAADVPRLLSMDAFKVYREAAGDPRGGFSTTGPDVAAMIVSEEGHAELMTSLRRRASGAFAEVERYAHSFDVFKDMYIENSKLSRDAILRRKESTEFFRQHLKLYKEQMEAISSQIPNSKDVALFTVRTEGLREFFTPSPLACLDIVRQVLPVIVHNENEALLQELQRHTSYLATGQKAVEQYVEYLRYYKKFETQFDHIAASYDFVRELFALIQEEKIEVSDEDEETFRSGTRPQFDKLRTLMQVVEDGKEFQQRQFTRNIDEQMELLRRQIESVYDKAGQPIVIDAAGEVGEVIAYISQLQAEAQALATREAELRSFQLEIGAEETTVDTLVDMLGDINLKSRLWTGIRDWDDFAASFAALPFGQVDMQLLQDTVAKYSALVKQVAAKLAGSAAVLQLKSKVEEWRQLLPVLQALSNPNLRSEHIAKMSSIAGKIEDTNGGAARTLAEWANQYTIEMLLANDILKYREEIQAVSTAATEEDKLQQQIDKVDAMWNGGGPKPPAEFQFHGHKDASDVYTLVGVSVEDVMALLADSMIAISTIGSSKYCSGVLRAQVDRWERRLHYMEGVLDRWVELQRSWIYLENVFASSEIRSQWKDDATRFEKVDRFFRDLMRKAHDLPTAYRGLLINPPSFDPGESFVGRSLQQELDHHIKELEMVLASLEKKLDDKRRSFPRFYFLSNDDLLEILAHVKTPELMMPHMLKMFDGIKSLTFGDHHEITHLVSMEGEVVELVNKGVKARGAVETWMDQLEHEMFTSLRKHAQACLEDYESCDDRVAWMFRHPAQLVLIMEQLLWTRGVEEALDKPNSIELMERQKEANYETLMMLAGLTSKPLSKIERTLLSTRITIDVHGRDLVEEMCASNIMESNDFGWTKQLRAYWEKDEDGQGNIFIRQNNSRFVYGYEYLGAQGRLVITPLTDRIYMTVTGALKLHLGASPAGPAGTGKTETVKDLAKTLARQCIVYNCSDGVTYKMMEKFFSGLIQTGAWACLDEFNRINVEVLSVIASQLFEIKLALQNAKSSFTFQGTPDVRVRPTYGAFVTMNPGYAGRTELPDNLKVLFRPVAVMTPDFRMIAEVILYSEGFTHAKDLSLKITQLYKLSSEQLSSQDHYDFGMRALKSILVMAGDLKRSQPDVDEDLTLIVACNDSNIPKLVVEDLPLFRSILTDLFPGVTFPERQYEELLPHLHRVMDSKHLVDAGAWVQKGTQFYETLIVRHGVMLVGVTGTGKTASRDCIAETLTSLAAANSANPVARPVHQFLINPKSVLLHELYGELDANTNEWRDGVLATIAKQCVRDSEESADHRWIVFDGPVDTLWIESLNSVLDDSKLLCLDSGERIKLPDTIHMLFEVADLAVASPATVSRCGMVYVDADDLPWSAVVRQWAATKLVAAGVEPQCREYIASLFLTYGEQGLQWWRLHKSQISAGEINVVQSMCDLFTALVHANHVQLASDAAAASSDVMLRERNETCHLIFAFSYIWSVGGNVDAVAMESFDTHARAALEALLRIPGRASVYDYTMDLQSRLLVPWEAQLEEYVYNPTVPFFNVLVPTVDTLRYSTLAKVLLQSGKALLFNGQSGVGKSVIMAECLRANKETLQLLPVTFQFSAQTSSARVQEMLEAKLKHKRKNILGAPAGKSFVLFVDDLNMPALEVFGASPPIELLRQIMGNGGFYDRKVSGFWKHVQDLTVVAACGPAEGGRNPLTPRLTRLFHLLRIPNLNNDSMTRIFGSILAGFLEQQGFRKEVRDLSKALTGASVDVFTKVREVLRPRPTTPHYTFNLRDLAKVFQGMTQVIPRVCRDEQAMVRLWAHECMRCFSDRLSTPEDRDFFTNDVMMDAISRLQPGSQRYAEGFKGDPVVWGDFLRFGAPERVYEEASDFKRIPQILDEYQEDYNNAASAAKPDESTQTSQLSLVFFKDHCEHLARIVRILRQPRGNALLVGVGGSGKRSIARLASHIAECKVFEIAAGRGSGPTEFREFLLDVYTYAGVQYRSCVFVLADNQIVHEGMLEDVSNILNSGDVPSLFTPEEREKRINACLEAAHQQGINDRDDVYNYFISRVRDKLHVALCMSPVGDAFRNRCRQFPSLTNCCTIDWFDAWPSEALSGVAARLLEEVQDTLPAELFATLPDLCVDTHATMVELTTLYWEELRRHYYVTPTSYLEFIVTYKHVFSEQRRVLQEQLARVEGGTDKMRQTDETIAAMKMEIEVKRPQLEKASTETQAVVADLKTRQTSASAAKVQVKAQQESATTQQQQASKIASEANGRLAEAKPIIDRAKAALDTIQASDLNELRSFANPPSAVLKTTQACMTMFDAKDFNGAWSGSTDWKGAREFLSYRPLLDMIRNYPTDNVKPGVLQRIQKYINDDEFTVEICSSKGSQTCGSLCAWVHAVNEYSKVVKEVAPMRAAAAEAEQHLAETNAKLQAAQQQLQEVEKELEQLERNYERSLKQKNDLEKDLQMCLSRLENAETLSGSLRSEGVRWAENVKVLQRKLQELPLQSFVASACMAYFGAFTPAFRKRLMARWREKFEQRGLDISGVTLTSVMGDPVATLNWNVNGLPTDETSTENAIITTASCTPRRWPLLIDPQEQALKWLTRQYGASAAGGGPNAKAKNTLKIIKPTEPTWMRTLEAQIRLGGAVILTDIGETLDPALEPLLARRLFRAGDGTIQIQLTAQAGPVDYHPNFRFFMCTKLPNPHFLPDVSTGVTLLNFTVTREGLEDQLLGEVVSIEKRELEEEKNRVIQSIAQGQQRLKKIEETILERLHSSKGNILDDRELIDELKSAQSSAEVLEVNQKEAAATIAVISGSREKYRDVAIRASVLFFVLADVARIDPMYQYSLDFFVRLVRHEVEAARKPAEGNEGKEDTAALQEHLTTVMQNITAAAYRQVCRGLFNKDRIIFAFLMSTAIARQSGQITEEEWQYLMRATALVPNQPPPQPEVLSWLSRQSWELAEALNRTVPIFAGLVDSLVQSPDEWHTYVRGDDPQSSPVPCGWEARLNCFHRALLIRCFREEKLFLALSEYVKDAMGSQVAEPPSFDLGSALKESTASTPVVFVLSQGADPMGPLQALAAAEGAELSYVSLGQGQGENARRLIVSCRASGAWLLLQNCHLSRSFMPELEAQVALLQSSASGTTHPNFRLWLTSMPTDFFPITVLQISLKLTNEPPTGLRANMQRCFSDLTPHDYEAFSNAGSFGRHIPKGAAFKKLLYGLCFFHSIVLERKKFGPLGWNVRYEWNDTDFHVSKQWLHLFFAEQDEIPWASLEYIIGQINYGGRVTDPQDRGTLQTILRQYVNPSLLEPGHTFSASGNYALPQGDSLEAAMAHIAAMSAEDDPEVFGMNENANLRYQLQTSQYVLQTLVSIQPRVTAAASGGSRLSPEEEVCRKCQELEATLPENLSSDEAGPHVFAAMANGMTNSLATVLLHEMSKYNKLLTRMRRTLADLQKALQGLTVLSSDLDAMFSAFLTDQVPQLWSAVSYASLKPLAAWYRDLRERVGFIRGWLHKGQPTAFWLGGLFNPSAFVTAVYQTFSRVEGVSIDKLGFSFKVIETPVAELTSPPARGCYVYGIFSDAWRWDSTQHTMADSLPGEQYTSLPVLHFLPEANHVQPATSHAVPLYRTTVRAGVISSLGASSNYVLSIEIPSTESSDYWQLKGAASACALNH